MRFSYRKAETTSVVSIGNRLVSLKPCSEHARLKLITCESPILLFLKSLASDSVYYFTIPTSLILSFPWSGNQGTSNLHRHLDSHHKICVRAFLNQNRSPIWKYYNVYDEDGRMASCKLCEKMEKSCVYKIGNGSTKSLHYHLRVVHSVTVGAEEPDELLEGSSNPKMENRREQITDIGVEDPS